MDPTPDEPDAAPTGAPTTPGNPQPGSPRRRNRPTQGSEGTEGTEGTGRIEAFSDGVYAIAITLLVLNLGIPAGLDDGEVWGAITEQGPKLLAAALSFVVIGLFWWAHQRTFATIGRTNSRLVWVNLAHLATIVFLPFPTEVLAEYSDSFAGVTLYALTLAAASFTSAALTWLAWRSDIALPTADTSGLRARFISFLTTGTIFTASVGVAWFSPDLATYTWILAVVADRPVERLARRR